MKIDKKVPLPAIRSRSNGALIKIAYPFDKMKIGDSFGVELDGTRSNYEIQCHINQNFRRWKKHTGSKIGIITRTIEGEVRCWRVN